LTFRNHSIQPYTSEDVYDEIECFSYNVVMLCLEDTFKKIFCIIPSLF